MIVLAAADVRQALPMEQVIASMKRAFAAFSEGRAQVPQRHHLSVTAHGGIGLVMSAFVDDPDKEAMVVKVASVYPRNPERGIPTITATVLALEPSTGQVMGLLEGATLTAIRTGAASGAATDLLARADSEVAAIFGAGAQGRTQLEGICTVRPIRMAWVHDVDPSRVEAYIAEMAGQGPIPSDLRAASSPKQAVADADVICCATTSAEPVFADADLKPGVHINGIGSYTPAMREVPPETVTRALVVVDSRVAVLAEAGDLIKPIERGIIGKTHIHAELGEVVLGRKSGRTSPEQVTFFKTVGIAVEDAAAARVAMQNAMAMGLGQRVEW